VLFAKLFPVISSSPYKTLVISLHFRHRTFQSTKVSDCYTDASDEVTVPTRLATQKRMKEKKKFFFILILPFGQSFLNKKKMLRAEIRPDNHSRRNSSIPLIIIDSRLFKLSYPRKCQCAWRKHDDYHFRKRNFVEKTKWAKMNSGRCTHTHTRIKRRRRFSSSSQELK
jgi:hypothetical protein